MDWSASGEGVSGTAVPGKSCTVEGTNTEEHAQFGLWNSCIYRFDFHNVSLKVCCFNIVSSKSFRVRALNRLVCKLQKIPVLPMIEILSDSSMMTICSNLFPLAGA